MNHIMLKDYIIKHNYKVIYLLSKQVFQYLYMGGNIILFKVNIHVAVLNISDTYVHIQQTLMEVLLRGQYHVMGTEADNLGSNILVVT